jgi:hypothetical protein
MSPEESYLTAARRAGTYLQIGNIRLVAGHMCEPLTGESRCFVEYCDRKGYGSPEALARVCSVLMLKFPQAESLVLRARDGLCLPDPWRRMVTYVRHTGRGGCEHRQQEVCARRASAGDDELVRQWIIRALTDGYRMQDGHVLDPRDVRRAADDVLGAPGRVSILALAGGHPIGHVTLLDGYDDAIGRPYVDLMDMLVEPGEHASAAREALAVAAADHARTAGVPLIGNVTHDVNDRGDAVGQRVLAGLMRRGAWIIDHVDWQAKRQ